MVTTFFQQNWEGNLHIGGSLNLKTKYTIEILHNKIMNTN